MGWARNTKDPIWFAQMTHKLHLLDYNILYLDYDKKKGFGEYKSIDIWWEGFDKDCYLTLHYQRSFHIQQIGIELKLEFYTSMKLIAISC